MEIKEFNTIIDTIAIKTDINNFEDFTTINNERYDYIDRVGDNFDNSVMKIKVNLHTNYGEMQLDSLKKHNKALEETLKEIGVLEVEKVALDRVDIALDTNGYEYTKDFKKMLFAYELLTIKHKKSSRWYTTNLNTLRNNSIKLYDSRFELEIYDKNLESNGVHPYNVRVEFRYKRLDKDIAKGEEYIHKVIDKVNEMDKHLPMLEENMAKRLIKLYEMDKENVRSFSEFVRKYNDYFYTINILKEVYKSANMKGTCTNWIREFRRVNNLEFYTIKDIKELQKAMLKSLKTYIK